MIRIALRGHLTGALTREREPAPRSSRDRQETPVTGRFSVRPVRAPPVPSMTDERWQATWVAGASCGRSWFLDAGRHVVGRAPHAAVRTDDPDSEPHHAVLELADDGAPTIVQLCGHVPVRVGHEPVGAATALRDGALVHIGSGVLVVRRAAAVEASDPPEASTSPRAVVRTTRLGLRGCTPDAVRSPELSDPPPTSALPIAPALCTTIATAAIATVVHQPMLVMFAMVGAIATMVTAVVQLLAAGRARRRSERSNADALDQFRTALAAAREQALRRHAAAVMSPAHALDAIEGRTRRLWERRGEHGDAFEVGLGLGRWRWQPTVEGAARHVGAHGDDTPVTRLIEQSAVLDDVVIPIELGPGCRLAITGDRRWTRAVARSLVLQLAAASGPVDWRLTTVSDGDAWSWCAALPHAGPPDDGHQHDGHQHVVVLTDDAAQLARPDAVIRRLLDAEPDACLLLVVDVGVAVPATCTSLVEIGPHGSGRWWPDVGDALGSHAVHVAGVEDDLARAAAGRLASHRDPEARWAADSLPTQVSLSELLDRPERGGIAARWLRREGRPTAPTARLGRDATGVVEIDLARDGPHALVAGTTGSGKSELLRSWVLGMAIASSPRELNLVLVDYKGGAAFDVCARLPHVVGLVTDLDDRLAMRALRSLRAELRRRERTLRDHGATDIDELHRGGDVVMARLVVMIDELATLTAEVPGFVDALVGIAQRGRSLGVHLVLATQRPAGAVSDDIRANTNLRIALRVHGVADAIDVVGDPMPAHLPRDRPGRAVMRLGPAELTTFQVAHCDRPATIVDEIVAASREEGDAAPRRPWQPPLPEVVDPTTVPADVVGLVDDPDEQRVAHLRWDRRHNLLVAGSLGSGVTTTLRSVVSVALADRAPTHVYVVDGRGDPSLAALVEHPMCAAVVQLHEHERLRRTIGRLAREVRERTARAAVAAVAAVDDGCDVLLVVDGLAAVRAALDEHEDARSVELLHHVLADGPARGVVAVLGTDRPTAVPASVASLCAERWVLRLADPLDATWLGVPAASVPTLPGRLVVASSGLEAHVAARRSLPARWATAHPLPPPVEELPRVVRAIELRPSSATGDGAHLVVGTTFESLSTAAIEVPDGEHLVVLGPPRSGRSTALVRIAAAWIELHPEAALHVVAPRRSPLRAALDDHAIDLRGIGGIRRGDATLIVVDDAELLDDEGGLSELLADRDRPVTVAVAARPDALRQRYGHWTATLRRSRSGLVMAACEPIDGDLVGASLPRRAPLPARPGLAWMVSGGDAVLVQIAVDVDTSVDTSVAGRRESRSNRPTRLQAVS